MPEAGVGALLSNKGKVTEFSIQNLVLASILFTCIFTGTQALTQIVLIVDNLNPSISINTHAFIGISHTIIKTAIP